MPEKEDLLTSLREQMARVESGVGTIASSAETDDVPRCMKRRGTSSPAAKSEKAGTEDQRATGTFSDIEKASVPEKPKDVSADAAFKRMVDLISHAMRTESELRRRLKREGFPDASIAPALARAKDCNLVNDEIFAEQFTLSRRSRNMGFNRIRRDLLAKGVDPIRYAFWQELQDEMSPENQFAEALDYASRHIPSSKHPGKSLYAALIRRGYPANIASRVVRELDLSLYD